MSEGALHNDELKVQMHGSTEYCGFYETLTDYYCVHSRKDGSFTNLELDDDDVLYYYQTAESVTIFHERTKN